MVHVCAEHLQVILLPTSYEQCKSLYKNIVLQEHGMTMGSATDASAGVGKYSSTINQVKGHIPGTWVRHFTVLLGM